MLRLSRSIDINEFLIQWISES